MFSFRFFQRVYKMQKHNPKCSRDVCLIPELDLANICGKTDLALHLVLSFLDFHVSVIFLQSIHEHSDFNKNTQDQLEYT